jgi:hypothetical protein
MPHNFDDKQQLDPGGSLPLARGPVDTGEKMFWIAALVWQNNAGKHAAATGQLDWSETPWTKSWWCPTTMVPGSKPFSKGQAEAWALALVTEGNKKVFYRWRDDVELV